MFFLEACQSLFWANTFDLNDPQLGLWFNKMQSYCPSFLQISINCGCHLDMQRHLKGMPTLCSPCVLGEHVLSKDGLIYASEL